MSGAIAGQGGGPASATPSTGLNPMFPPTLRLSPDGLIATAPVLSGIPWLRHGITTRRFGTRDDDRVEELGRLRSRIVSSIVPLFHADQRHTAAVSVVDREALARAAASPDRRVVFPPSDAVVSPGPGVALAVFTADCVPLFLVDLRRRAIGMAHAGWRGTFDGIAGAAVGAMLGQGSRAEDLLAWIGPAAGVCCYEVDGELADRFDGCFNDATAEGVGFRRGRHIDLESLNAWQLERAGLAPAAIHRSGVCTICRSDLFYSYRADGGPTGRIISMMASLEDAPHPVVV